MSLPVPPRAQLRSQLHVTRRGTNKLPAHADLFAPQAASREQLSSPSPPRGTVKAGESAASPLRGGKKAAALTAANPGAFPGVCSPPGSTHRAQPPAPCRRGKELLQPWLVLLPRLLSQACPSPQGCPRAPGVSQSSPWSYARRRGQQAFRASGLTATEGHRQTPQLEEIGTGVHSAWLGHYL